MGGWGGGGVYVHVRVSHAGRVRGDCGVYVHVRECACRESEGQSETCNA